MNIVVLGGYRGGTSMVAGVLRGLGVFMGGRMGAESGGTNHEDLDFQLQKPLIVRHLIDKRNKSHKDWGWKDPNTINIIDKIKDRLVDPKYIVIFRDPYAMAMSEHKRNYRDIKVGLQHAIKQQQKLVDFASTNECLMLSYEKCLQNRESFVNAVVNHLDIMVSPDQLVTAAEAITNGCYTKTISGTVARKLTRML